MVGNIYALCDSIRETGFALHRFPSLPITYRDGTEPDETAG